MDILGIGKLIDGVGKVADDLFTSTEERKKINLLKDRLQKEIMNGQIKINLEEAKHKSTFVAGWRPFVGWVGGFALGYQFLLYPILNWFWAYAQAKGWINGEILPPAAFDSGILMTVVTGMLGVGGMRSFDKLKKTQTDKIK